MRIFVRVKTRSKKRGVMKTSESHYTVMVSEEPTDGKANEAVITQLLKYFNVEKERLSLESGEKSNIKEFIIDHKRKI